MAEFQPPPTYAEVVLIDDRTKKATFNPIWLKWFIDLSANLGPGGAGTVTSVQVSGGTTGLTTSGGPIATSGTITLAGTLAATNGGTGQTVYAVGDLLYASTTTVLSKLADIATGNALISGGVSTAPSWGKVGLTTHISGTLPVANGGTGVTASTGSVAVVLSTSPTLITPILGVAAATSINFGVTALNYYGEGTWTPTDASGGGLTFTNPAGSYERIGRMFRAGFTVVFPATADANNVTIGNCPFTVSNNTYARQGFVTVSSEATALRFFPDPGATTGTIRTAAGVNVTNITMSTDTLIATFLSHV